MRHSNWQTAGLWLALLGLLMLGACSAAGEGDTDLLPEPEGPALVFFYTDG